MDKELLEVQKYKKFISELGQETKKIISIEPSFIYKGKRIRLDFVSQSDKIFLEKIFKEIEDNKNDNINFDKLKDEAIKEYTTAQEIEKIQAKKYITVKEFTEIYNYSSDWQKNRRSRIHDHLPYQQTKNGGKITYVVSEIETWFQNNNSGR